MKIKTTYFLQYIYLSVLFYVGQRRLNTVTIPNDFGGKQGKLQ